MISYKLKRISKADKLFDNAICMDISDIKTINNFKEEADTPLTGIINN
jgi:hypothetical protein